jgi:anti-anti-sigma regulatory factor
MSNHQGMTGDNLLLVKQRLVVNLPNNVDRHDIEAIEGIVLHKLADDRGIKGVIVGMGGVQTTDPDDLRRLAEALSTFRLLGAKIGFCGINPGVAAIMIRAGIELPHDAAGHDLDDVLKRMA